MGTEKLKGHYGIPLNQFSTNTRHIFDVGHRKSIFTLLIIYYADGMSSRIFSSHPKARWKNGEVFFNIILSPHFFQALKLEGGGTEDSISNCSLSVKSRSNITEFATQREGKCVEMKLVKI
jgi:hypothetical protein